MEVKQPILIAGPPRSGTTMIAGLLGKHGVWIGNGRTTMYPGTNPEFVSENQDIKEVFKKEAKRQGYKNWSAPLPQSSKIKKKDIEQFVPKGPWLVKTSWNLIFADFWLLYYPEARWILPWRKTRDIIDSMNRHPGMRKHNDEEKQAFVRALQERQLKVQKLSQYSHMVSVRQLSHRAINEISSLMWFIGIETDWEITNNWIEPKLMTHGV